MKDIFLFFKQINKRWLALMFDVIAIPIAWYCAYWLRYNMDVFPVQLSNINALKAFMLRVRKAQEN